MAWNRVGIYHCRGRKLEWLVRWYGEIDPETGTPTRYSRSFHTKAEADDFKAAKQAEFKKTGRRDRQGDETLKHLCDVFLRTKKGTVRPSSHRLYRYTVQRLLKHFGPDRRVGTIKKIDVDLFMAAQVYRQNGRTKLSDWTRLQILNHLRTILGAAVGWEWITENQARAVDRPKPRKQEWHHLRPMEYGRLLEAAPDLRWQAFYALAYTSGAREGELFSLTWGDVDFDKAMLRIRNRKGTPTLPPFVIKDAEPRNVPLPRATLKILLDWQVEAPEGVPYILLTAERYRRVLARWERLGRADDRWENRFMVNNALRDMRVHAKRAEIDFDGEFTIHCFRKSFGQNHADNGTPIKTLQYLLGHSSEKTTLEFYTQVPKDHADQARDIMERLLAKAGPNGIDAQLTREGGPSENLPHGEVTAESVNPDSMGVYEP
jgi:integrase